MGLGRLGLRFSLRSADRLVYDRREFMDLPRERRVQLKRLGQL